MTHRSLSPCPHAVCAQCGEVGVATSATVNVCLNVLHIDPVYMYIHKCYFVDVTCTYTIGLLPRGFSGHRE